MSWQEITNKLAKASSATRMVGGEVPSKQMHKLLNKIAQEFDEIRTMVEEQVAEDAKVSPEEVRAAIASIQDTSVGLEL